MTVDAKLAGEPPRTSLTDSWVARLEGRQSRIAFADGDDVRVREAAHHLVGLGIRPLLVSAKSLGEFPPGVDVRRLDELADGPVGDDVFTALRGREMSEEVAAAARLDPIYLAASLTRRGDTQATVAGSTRPTSDVLRVGLRLFGLAAGVSSLSSSFLMHLPDGRNFCFADCAVIPEPTARQLADIAQSSAGTFSALTGEEPVVALLSFSTKGSAQHHSLGRLHDARDLVSAESPELLIDAELQFDAALVASVASHKAPGSAVAGRANVFIFPDLASGNIGYKIAERLAAARSFGPLLQGLSGVLNDLSRGCTADDIVNVALISALQAAQ